MLGPLLCPLPALAPPPPRSTLEWSDDGSELQLRTLLLVAVLRPVSRQATETLTVEPPPPPSPKKRGKGKGRGGVPGSPKKK